MRSDRVPEEYTRGFEVFDRDGKGFIKVGELRYILTHLGETMTDEEVDELLKLASVTPYAHSFDRLASVTNVPCKQRGRC